MKPKQRATITVVLACLPPLLLANARDGSAPPSDNPVSVIDWPATLSSPPSTGVKLGSLHIEFEKTSLSNIRAAIGVGRFSQQGDAGDSVTWLCYTLPSANGTARLWLISGEMGGGRFITGVSIRVSNSFATLRTCPVLPRPFRIIAFDHSLRIDQPSTQWIHALGKPSHEADGWRMFDYRASLNHDKCELSNWLWTRSTNGRLTAIDAGQITSC